MNKDGSLTLNHDALAATPTASPASPAPVLSDAVIDAITNRFENPKTVAVRPQPENITQFSRASHNTLNRR